MATLNSDLVVKKIRHRGLYSGKEQSVTGSIKLSAGTSVATTDLLQMVPLGENVRPIRILLQVTPLSGTPVLTNAVFDVGVKSISTTALTRPDGTSYPALITDADQLAANVTLANNTKTTIEIPRPVADSVANYGPYYVTLTPDTSAGPHFSTMSILWRKPDTIYNLRLWLNSGRIEARLWRKRPNA